MTCSELKDQIIGHIDNTPPSDADVTDSATRILEHLIAIVNDICTRRSRRWRRRTSSLLTFTSGSVGVPSDFGEMGPYGGLFNSGTGEKLRETDESEIVLLRQGLSARNDVFAIYDQDTTTGVMKFQIPTTAALTAYASYLAATPTLDYTANNDKLKVAVPAQYHQTVIVPGVQWKRQRAKGDARSNEYRSQYEDQLTALLQMYVGRSLNEIGARPVRNAAQRAAGARTDDHAAREERAARHRGHEILPVKVLDVAAGIGGGEQAFEVKVIEVDGETEFLADHVAARGADRKVHVPPARAEHLEQPHGIDRAARARDANANGVFHDVG